MLQRVMLVSALIPSLLSAQTLEMVVRDREAQTDVAIRTTIPHVMLEYGTVRAGLYPDVVRDHWLYAVTGGTIGRVSVAAEAFVAPSSKFVSRSSLGGTLGYEVTPRFRVDNRTVYYLNPDKSVQWLSAVSGDYTVAGATFGGSIGRLTNTGLISQLRVSRSSRVDQTFAYYSNNMEVPDMPWSVWVVREIGIKERIKVGSTYEVLIGVARGEMGTRRYSSIMIGNKILFNR